MLSYVLALVVASGSFALYMAAFFFPEVHRKNDFIWSGVGLFYALVLWVCAERITGGVLLGQTAGVVLLGWLGWQTFMLRRQAAPFDQQTPLPTADEVKGALSDLTQSENFSKLSGQAARQFDKLKNRAQGLLDRASSSKGAADHELDEPYVPLTPADFGPARRMEAEGAIGEVIEEVVRTVPPANRNTASSINSAKEKATSAFGIVGDLTKGLSKKKESKPTYVRKQYRKPEEQEKPADSAAKRFDPAEATIVAAELINADAMPTTARGMVETTVELISDAPIDLGMTAALITEPVAEVSTPADQLKTSAAAATKALESLEFDIPEALTGDAAMVDLFGDETLTSDPIEVNHPFVDTSASPDVSEVNSLFATDSVIPEVGDRFGDESLTSEFPEVDNLLAEEPLTSEVSTVNSLFGDMPVVAEAPEVDNLFTEEFVISQVPEINDLFGEASESLEISDVDNLLGEEATTPNLPEVDGLFGDAPIGFEADNLFVEESGAPEILEVNDLFGDPPQIPEIPEVGNLFADAPITPDVPEVSDLFGEERQGFDVSGNLLADEPEIFPASEVNRLFEPELASAAAEAPEFGNLFGDEPVSIELESALNVNQPIADLPIDESELSGGISPIDEVSFDFNPVAVDHPIQEDALDFELLDEPLLDTPEVTVEPSIESADAQLWDDLNLSDELDSTVSAPLTDDFNLDETLGVAAVELPESGTGLFDEALTLTTDPGLSDAAVMEEPIAEVNIPPTAPFSLPTDDFDLSDELSAAISDLPPLDAPAIELGSLETDQPLTNVPELADLSFSEESPIDPVISSFEENLFSESNLSNQLDSMNLEPLSDSDADLFEAMSTSNDLNPLETLISHESEGALDSRTFELDTPITPDDMGLDGRFSDGLLEDSSTPTGAFDASDLDDFFVEEIKTSAEAQTSHTQSHNT
jgi:hypothetical protein